MSPSRIVFFLASAGLLLANGGGYLKGVKSTGPFRPVNVEQVQMVSENLDIELREEAAAVNITYVLHNPGKAVTVEMGFPCSVAVRVSPVVGRDNPPPVLPQLQEFKLTVDEKPFASKLMKDHAVLSQDKFADDSDGATFSQVLTGWQVVKLPFTAAQTRLVKVSYLNPWYRSVRTVSDDSYASAPSMRYLFSAAALWSGPIRTGTVTVRATGVDPGLVTFNRPKRFQREGNTWTWSFTDFEPTLQDDLEVIAGEAEASIRDYSGSGDSQGRYTVRGRASGFDELRKTGRWSFEGHRYTAKASSSLKSDGGFTYGPENLYDGDWQNAWVEGAEGDGIGESLTLTMKTPQKATKLSIYNGYRKDRQTFLANNRVKSLAVCLNGAAPFTVELKDGYEAISTIPVPKDTGPLKTAKLTIQSVYPGTSYHDTCISMVEVEVQLSKRPNVQPAR
jgi:hypothetical protein